MNSANRAATIRPVRDDAVLHPVYRSSACSAQTPFMRAQTDIAEIVDYGTDYLRVVCMLRVWAFSAQIAFERLLQSTGRDNAFDVHAGHRRDSSTSCSTRS